MRTDEYFKPIIALDFPNGSEASSFLEHFQNEQLYLKVGMELYYQEGADLIKQLKNEGHHVFLDLKLHDIPNTVYRAMKVLAGLSVDMVNVHAAGGSEMMKAALQGLEEGTKPGKIRPALIAVTQLTSTSEGQMQKEQLIGKTIKESVLHYALLAHQSNLDGVVCSAHEASDIIRETSHDFLRVTPGIRLLGGKSDDQKRIVTPGEAREKGASMIVIGRPVTQAAEPVSAYQTVLNEWSGTNE